MHDTKGFSTVLRIAEPTNVRRKLLTLLGAPVQGTDVGIAIFHGVVKTAACSLEARRALTAPRWDEPATVAPFYRDAFRLGPGGVTPA
jgi:hypothetical protein